MKTLAVQHSLVLVILNFLQFLPCHSVYSPPLLATRTVREGTTTFRMDLMPLLRSQLGDAQADSARRISFFKEKEAYPFHILSDGQIGLQGALDREQVCRSGSPCPEQCCKLLRIEVRLATSQTREFYIRLLIDDVNDSPPNFENHIDRVYLSLSEDSRPGYELELPAASDADTPENGVKEYKISNKLPGNVTFDRHFLLIDSQWPLTPKLRLTLPIDREETPEMGFIFLAVDGGEPQLTGSLSVLIEIKDVNDDTPRIVDFKPGYTIRLNETATSFHGGSYSRQQVARFRVEDRDSNDNGRVKCDIKPPPSVEPRLRADRYFEVKPMSGGPNLWELKTLLAIDYEQVKSFSFHIVASDFGMPRHSSSVSVSIIVQNIDDHLISITFWNAGDRRDRVELLENSPSGLKIASVEVKDPDLELKSEYGRLHCTLTSGAGLFRLEEKEVFGLTKEFNLRTVAVFDREQRDEHRVVVACQDSMNSAASSTATLTVTISDVNDCPPEFSRQLYRGSVPENSSRRKIVQMDAGNRIQAVDRDAFPNNRIVYKLQGPGAAPFSIDVQGNILVNGELDYEHQKSYRFNVTAVNENNASMRSVAGVVIDVIDVNDNPPIIVEYDKGYRFNVQEEISDIIIGRINATDADTLPENSRVNFRILTADGSGLDGFGRREADRYFRIDPNSGDVRVVARIDREQYQYFQFRVLAENPSSLVLAPGSSRLSASEPGSPSVTTVTVYVTNINDHPPRLCQTLSSVGGQQTRETCNEPPQLLRVQFIDSGIFYNRQVLPEEHRCTLFDYEIRDPDDFADSSGFQQPKAVMTLENITELRQGARHAVTDGSVQFRFDSQQLCIQRLPARQADREIYEMIIRVEDPSEPRHRREYPCVVTIVRTRPQPPVLGGDVNGGRGGQAGGVGGNYNYERGGHRTVNRLDEGPVERRNFVIIVTLVTVVVFIIVIVFAFVLFFYVKKIDRSIDNKEFEAEAVTMPLQGQSATAVPNSSGTVGKHHPGGGGTLAEAMPLMTEQLLYSNSHRRDPQRCCTAGSSEDDPDGIETTTAAATDRTLNASRHRRYEVWCNADQLTGGTLMSRPSLTLRRQQQQQQPPGSAGLGPRKMTIAQRANSCDELDCCLDNSASNSNNSGGCGYQTIDPFAELRNRHNLQQAPPMQQQQQQQQQQQHPGQPNYQRLQQGGTVVNNADQLYSPKKSLKSTYFETSFV
ncbi:hypothetical protein BOX15_Mlig002128g1 [Macrostomum lignano]|uniref:Cadherin domain-containing protein n=1 Tax=Macrostomum lignano TaxID=282301 RepID=A0A267H6M4_9PLAT|nr:hypothetical protein BOX15_Mlig002128g1 [Macrostomum lignano]